MKKSPPWVFYKPGPAGAHLLELFIIRALYLRVLEPLANLTLCRCFLRYLKPLIFESLTSAI